MRRRLPTSTRGCKAIPGKQHPVEGEIYWALDLLRGNHPTFREDDFTIVEDTTTGKIVSVTNLIDQVWSYGGIPFGVGRPESVGTSPEYRNRGLVRAQFDVLHQWSAERGHLVQGITGIPYYYRQFGYEMAMDLSGGRIGYPQTIPPLKAGEVEAYRFRPVTETDLPFILDVDAYSAQRLLVACIRDAALWHYEVFGKSEQNLTRLEWRIVETADGEPVGYVGHGFKLDGDGRLHMPVFELKPGASWLAVAPGLLRYLKATGEAYAARDGKVVFGRLCFARPRPSASWRRCGAGCPKSPAPTRGICGCPICRLSCATSRPSFRIGWRAPSRPATPASSS